MIRAFVDESMRQRAGDSRAYVLAAVLVSDGDAADLRDAMRGLRYRRSSVVHWRHERVERQSLITATLGELPWVGLVVVRLFDQGVRPERARRQCLAVLLRQLESAEVGEVVIETRRSAQDDHDRALLTALRKSGAVAGMDVRWQAPESEPLLWAADCVAGAVTWWFDHQPAHLDALASRVTILDVVDDA